MPKYFVDDIQVERSHAMKVWHGSRTYRLANPRTRGYIFLTAEKGESQDGEIQHLAEAGVRIAPDREVRNG
ncbi:hypothetical protein Xmlh_08380 [Xanthomonas axonopodis pv. melhusii]|uniref:Uncharacterized protein n=1 Tax=Xanthomonas axonopodis pv. melhusii TaxID=487834 RepID=A0A1T1P780_9XANT|nr:hypothetical protein [Xanthomonas axonopodis]OOW71480.1 hypothetical protein Xmlh_08380 [Xanthomonas axonopodis pv. melhusii]